MLETFSDDKLTMIGVDYDYFESENVCRDSGLSMAATLRTERSVTFGGKKNMWRIVPSLSMTPLDLSWSTSVVYGSMKTEEVATSVQLSV
jgi:hypothetical protein